MMEKRRRSLSILIIPEGEKQTFSVKIRYGFLKFLFVLLILFCIVLTVGTFSYWNTYWKLVELKRDSDQLFVENKNLLEKERIINDIANSFQSILETDKQLRVLFGDRVDFSSGDLGGSLWQSSLSGAGQTRVSFPAPLSRESLNRILNPFLRADIISAYPAFKPIGGEITQHFSRKDDVTGRGHFGVDLSAKEGSVVSAAGDGVVLFANWTVESGFMIVIDHQNGYISIYKHNAAILVQEREFVYQGESIALLGSSGISSAPHLHFEVWKNYVPINPLTLWSSN